MLAGAALVAIAIAVAIVAADRAGPPELAPGGPGGTPGEIDPEQIESRDLVIDEPPGRAEPRGVIWILCCGAWRPPEFYGIDLRRDRDRLGLGVTPWLARGYAVATFGYEAGAASVDDSLAAYDRLRAAYPDLGICAVGGSAAGHVALLVAAERESLGCVITLGAPTALDDLPDEPVGGLSISPHRIAVRAFGRSRLDRFSPLQRAGEIAAAVFLGACSEDPIVPASQAIRMARALRRGGAPDAPVESRIVPGTHPPRSEPPPPGTRDLIHSCFVEPEELDRYVGATAEFAERALR